MFPVLLLSVLVKSRSRRWQSQRNLRTKKKDTDNKRYVIYVSVDGTVESFS